MRILTISDKVLSLLYSPAIESHIGKIDLILSCGDLKFYYIDFIVSMTNAPCYFVLGNHDISRNQQDKASAFSPGGGTNLDGRVVRWHNLLLAGLEGSRRYNSRPEHQYTEGEMALKCLQLVPSLLWNRIRYGRYLDILITHAPPWRIHDADDLPHQGFRCFRWFMKLFKPKYLVHGHKHVYRHDEITETRFGETSVINTYPFKVIEYDEKET